MNSVECKETSTYKIGSRGKLGAQAVVKQSLKLKESSSSSSSSSTPSSLEKLSIQFEYDQTRSNELETSADLLKLYDENSARCTLAG